MLSWEKPLVKPMPPGSIFHHIIFYFTSYKFPIYNSSFLFTFFCNLYFPFHKLKIPKILLYRLSISIRSHIANNREGIDNPFIALVARFLIACAGTRWLVCCILLDWYLGYKNEGNTYATLLHHPFLFKGKPTHAQEVADPVEGWMNRTTLWRAGWTVASGGVDKP